MQDLAELRVKAESASVRQAAKDVRDLGTEGARTERQVDNLGDTVATTGRRSAFMGRSMDYLSNNFRNVRGQIQNTSYQLQDIAVQLEMGTSLTRTLGQQLPQLASGYGLVGSMIGLVIGVGFSMLSFFTDANAETKKATDLYDDLAGSLEELSKAMEFMTTDARGFHDELGHVDEKLASVLAKLKDIKHQDYLTAAKEAFQAMRAEQGIDGDGFFQELFNQHGERDTARERSKDMLGISFMAMDPNNRLLRNGNSEMVDQFATALENAERSMDDPDAQIGELEIMIKILEKRRDLAGEFTEQQALIYRWLLEQVVVAREYKETLDDTAAIRKKEADQLAHNNEMLEIFRAAQKRIREEAAELERITREVSFGPSQEELNAQEEYNQSVFDSVENSAKLTDEIGQAAKEALLLAGVDINSPISNAAKSAAILAGNLGVALNVAISLSNRQAAMSTYSGRGAGYEWGGRSAGSLPPGELDSIIEGFNRKKRKRGGGGGGSDRDPMGDIQRDIAQRERLLKVFGDERDLLETIFEIEDKLGDDRKKYSNEYITGIANQITALERLEEKDKEAIDTMQGFADTLESSISNTIRSMVDGTATFSEAVKSMAATVISELFEILVVQQLVGSFDASSGSGSGILGWLFGSINAKGNAFAGGSVVPFANGGVVGGPTTFGMSGGRTGLMGEAGPEAIMPLSRGSDGKLGVKGGGNTIKQTINLYANGDDSVKRIVAEAAPKIAKMAQHGMVDQRMRGGSVKSTFGR